MEANKPAAPARPDMSDDEYRKITERVHGLFPGLRRRGIYDIVVKEKGDGDQPHPASSRQGRQSLVPKEAAERAFQGPAAPPDDRGKGKERVHELQTARQREREIGELLDMFPALSRHRLEAAYDAHGQRLQPTVDHLLTAAADDSVDNNSTSGAVEVDKGNDAEVDDEGEDDDDEDEDDDDDDDDDDDEEEEGLKFRCMEYLRERWGQYADQLHRLTPEVARELQDHVRAYGLPGAHARPPAIEPVALSPEEERAREDLNSVFLFALTSSTDPTSSSSSSSPSSSSSSSSSSSGRSDNLRLSSEGVAGSAGWMAEWEEMERRDEEVARALQREEHERAADIERKDEQLARLIAVQADAAAAAAVAANADKEADEARRRREADDAEFARTLQEQFDAEKKGDAEVKRMMELMEEEEASMSLIRQLVGHERQFRYHHRAEDLMMHSDVQLCETLFAGDIHEFLTEDTRQVTDIKRVLQLELVRRFMAKWLQLKRTYGSYAEEARPRLGFHGTPEANIPNILQQGLLVPGTHGVIHRTDDGYYGAGIYLSPDARTSLAYAGGCGKLLVCAVLMGRIYKCEDLMHGAPCMPGFDSHMSPCEGELILFEAAQVLPCFVITIASAIRRPVPTPALAPAPRYQSTVHLTAKKAAKAKGGRTPKATAKQKRQRKLARRAQRAAKGGRK